MKNSILFLILLQSLFTFAQAPQKMTYQSVVRNSANVLVANQNVGVRISILEGSQSRTAVYSETHTVTTNANGLFTLEAGAGTPTEGVFANIAWNNGAHYIKSEIDPIGGTNYTLTSTKELLSVPYALYAANGITAEQADVLNAQATANSNFQAQIDEQAALIATQAEVIANQAAAIAAIYDQINPKPVYPVYHYGQTENGMEMFAFNGAEWSPVSTNTPENFYNIGYSGDNYIGQIANKSYWKIYNSATQTEQLFSFDGATWDIPSTSPMPERIYGLQTYIGVIGNKVYHKITTYLNVDGTQPVHEIYSFDGLSWNIVSTNEPPEGLWFSQNYIGTINNKIYYKIQSYANNDWYNPIYTLYSFDGNTWSTVSTNLPAGVNGMYTYIGAINNRIYHSSMNYSNNDWNNPITTLYSFDGTTWDTISTNTPERLSMEDTYVGIFNNKIYHNTYTWDNANQKDIYTLYSFDGNTWSTIDNVDAPAANYRFGGWLYLGQGGENIPNKSTLILH